MCLRIRGRGIPWSFTTSHRTTRIKSAHSKDTNLNWSKTLSQNEVTALFLDVIVEKGKLDYLLKTRTQSPQRNSKAKFFCALGFSVADSPAFVEAIKLHPITAQLESAPVSAWGRRFVFVCDLYAPYGARACIKSVWQIDAGATRPRLITAYPAG